MPIPHVYCKSKHFVTNCKNVTHRAAEFQENQSSDVGESWIGQKLIKKNSSHKMKLLLSVV